jgi:hypothetical protein
VEVPSRKKRQSAVYAARVAPNRLKKPIPGSSRSYKTNSLLSQENKTCPRGSVFWAA